MRCSQQMRWCNCLESGALLWSCCFTKLRVAVAVVADLTAAPDGRYYRWCAKVRTDTAAGHRTMLSVMCAPTVHTDTAHSLNNTLLLRLPLILLLHMTLLLCYFTDSQDSGMEYTGARFETATNRYPQLQASGHTTVSWKLSNQGAGAAFYANAG